MIIRKSFLVLLLSASVLAGCNQGDSNTSSNPVRESESEIQTSVKKHESVNLPINVFVDNKYEKDGFVRSITNVEFKNFDDSSEIEFFDRYGSAIRNLGYELQKDYKLLVISMKHEFQKETKNSPYGAYILNAGSGLVIGDENLANKFEFLRNQQERMATDFLMGKNFETTGNVLLAVPNEIATDKNLQLKIVQKIDDESQYIYVDLN